MAEDTNKRVEQFERRVHDDLFQFLRYKQAIDEKMPECPDVWEKWPTIVRSYIPDGAREYQKYPVVSLGWMMLMGMAMAYYWDTDWEKYSSLTDCYDALRDKNGYDNFDDTVLDMLHFEGDKKQQMSDLVAECASRTLSILDHDHIEPGTELAARCYIAALHQLYLMGCALELNILGYHMTLYDPTQN